MIISQLKCPQYLTSAERDVAKYLTENLNLIEQMTIQDLADGSFTSISTVNRFCNHINNTGFKEFKVQLIKELNLTDTSEYIDPNIPFSLTDSLNTVAKNLSALTQTTIQETEASLNYAELEEISKIIDNAKRVFVFARGDSYILAKSFQNRLRKINKYIVLADNNHESVYNSLNIDTQDAVLFITYRSDHAIYESIITHLRAQNIDTIAITGFSDALLPSLCKYRIILPKSESYDNKIANFTSQTSTKFVLDVLYSAIFRYNYQKYLANKKSHDQIVSKSLSSSNQ